MPSWSTLWHHQEVAIWLTGVVLFALLTLALWRRKAAKNDGESAEEVLKRRYADGEIDETIYEHMLKELRR